MTIATIGRSMENAPRLSVLLKRTRAQPPKLRQPSASADGRARLHTEEPFDDHLLTGVQALFDDQGCQPGRPAGLHGSRLFHLLDARGMGLRLVHRPLRNKQRIFVSTAAARVLSRTKEVPGFGKEPLAPSCLSVYPPAGRRDNLALVRVYAPIVRTSSMRPSRFGGQLLNATRVAHVFLFADVQEDLDRIHLRDGGHDRLRIHEVAHLRF